MDHASLVPSGRRFTGPAIWAALSALGWLVWFALAFALPRKDDPAVALQAAGIAIGLSLLGLVTYCATRPDWPRWARLTLLTGGLAALGAAWAFNLTQPWMYAFWTLAVVAAALGVGQWLGNHLERPAHLLPLCVALSLADIYSVWNGPTRHIAKAIMSYQTEAAGALASGGVAAMERVRAPLVSFFVAHLPAPGQGIAVPVLGIGDFVALSFLLRSAWRFGLGPLSLLGSALLGTAAALSLSQTLALPLPALPFILAACLGWLWLRQPAVRKLRRSEGLLTAVVIMLFAGLILLKRFG